MAASSPHPLPAHQIVADGPLVWELAWRPNLDSKHRWQILHPFGITPYYYDMTGPTYLRIRRVLDDQTYRHFIVMKGIRS